MCLAKKEVKLYVTSQQRTMETRGHKSQQHSVPTSYKSVIATENGMFLLDNGQIKHSNDGVTWTTVVLLHYNN